MLLVIDCGNTSVVMGLCDGGELSDVWRMPTDANRIADDYATHFQRHHHALNGAKITGAVIGSVVPDCLAALVQFTKSLGITPLVISGGSSPHGVELRLDTPAQAGADRIANAMAAREYPLPALVIDFGTATTFDLIDNEAAYIGGAIAPGVDLSLHTLYHAAAHLPLITAKDWHSAMPVLGKNTIDAMNSGLFYGYLGLIEGMIDRFEKELGEPPTVIATGGLARLFAEATQAIHHHDPDLTLRGLVRIHEHWSKHHRATAPKKDQKSKIYEHWSKQ